MLLLLLFPSQRPALSHQSPNFQGPTTNFKPSKSNHKTSFQVDQRFNQISLQLLLRIHQGKPLTFSCPSNSILIPSPQMPNRTTWTKAMLLRMQELDRQGKNVNEITDALFEEFGGPTNGGETRTELEHLKTDPHPGSWTPAMEERLKTLHTAGKSDNEITNILFHEFAKPAKEQGQSTSESFSPLCYFQTNSRKYSETHRKIMQMKMQDQL